MRFSIIVPIFQAARYLEACISSVRNQSVRDWELILADDGSTDGSGEIADQAAASDPRIIPIHQQNCGQFFARRAGIRAARGEYLLFLDSDDTLALNCLEKLEGEICRFSPDMILFSSMVFENGAVTKRRLGWIGDLPRELPLPSLQESLLFTNDLNSLCFKTIRRCLFEDDESDYHTLRGLCFGEDKIQLLFPVSKANLIRYIPDSLYCYNHRPSSVMHDFQPERVQAMLQREMFSFLERYREKWGFDSPAHREALEAYRIRTFLSVYFGYRRRLESRDDKARFRGFPWKTCIRGNVFDSFKNKHLTKREKLKLAVVLSGL